MKKKGHRGREEDSDEEDATNIPKAKTSEIEFMTAEEIENVIRKEKALEDSPDELIREIAQQLWRYVIIPLQNKCFHRVYWSISIGPYVSQSVYPSVDKILV